MIIDPHPELPRPDPSSLADEVDWMTYSHQELYDMVHNGMDLTGAGAVAESWATLSDTLHDLGRELNSALTRSADGWQGVAADKARESLGSLVGWLHTTGDGAVGVSGCLTRQVAAADTARSTMPAPVDRPVIQPVGEVPAAGTTPAGAFAAGPQIMRPPLDSEWQAREAHQRAAQVMRQYQTTSYDIFRTVPEFAPPSTRRSFGVLDDPPDPAPHRPPPSGDPVLTGPVRPTAPGRPGGIGPAEPGRAGGAGIGEGESRVGPGSGSDAAASAGTDRAPAGRAGQPMGGGLGPSGARRSDDRERRAPRYLEEDERIFAIDERTTPPVIGG